MYLPVGCVLTASASRTIILHQSMRTLLYQISGSGTRNPFQSAPQPDATNDGPSRTVTTNVCQSAETTGVLLPTAWVTLTAENEITVIVRALIDQASEATLVTKKILQMLAACKVAANTTVCGVGGVSTGTTSDGVWLSVMSSLKAEERVNVLSILPSRPVVRGRCSNSPATSTC